MKANTVLVALTEAEARAQWRALHHALIAFGRMAERVERYPEEHLGLNSTPNEFAARMRGMQGLVSQLIGRIEFGLVALDNWRDQKEELEERPLRELGGFMAQAVDSLDPERREMFDRMSCAMKPLPGNDPALNSLIQQIMQEVEPDADE